ncbi:Hypothetical protein NTJ_07864 [Nesidiocoris tenuis]|uniref:Uncharacterized protein n=1 Tax=Nesidiocoris tenuis TaxID=355587 RepID=A0ABN7AVU1_9HEMI|nr:Hypothetical protein NTJ_07864 [Nesidiocoris tenuis]
MAPFDRGGEEAPQILTLVECASAHATFMAPFDRSGEEAPTILTLVECPLRARYVQGAIRHWRGGGAHNTRAGGMPLCARYVHGAI